MPKGVPPRPVLERLLKRIEIDPDTECWVWQGPPKDTGYGQMSLPGRKVGNTHRVAYERLVGPVPLGLVLDHLCRNRLCCNPDHLEPVTDAENIRRGASPTVAAGNADRCLRGHDMIEHGYVRPDGDGRICRACRRLRDRASRQQAA